MSTTVNKTTKLQNNTSLGAPLAFLKWRRNTKKTTKRRNQISPPPLLNSSSKRRQPDNNDDHGTNKDARFDSTLTINTNFTPSTSTSSCIYNANDAKTRKDASNDTIKTFDSEEYTTSVVTTNSQSNSNTNSRRNEKESDYDTSASLQNGAAFDYHEEEENVVNSDAWQYFPPFQSLSMVLHCNNEQKENDQKSRDATKDDIMPISWQYFPLVWRLALVLVLGYMLILLFLVMSQIYTNDVALLYQQNPSFLWICSIVWEYSVNEYRNAILVWYRLFMMYPLFVLVLWRSFFAEHATDLDVIDLTISQSQDSTTSHTQPQNPTITTGASLNNNEEHKSEVQYETTRDSNISNHNNEKNNNNAHNATTRGAAHKRPSLHEAFPKSSLSNKHSASNNTTSNKTMATVSFSSINYQQEYNQAQPPAYAFSHQEQQPQQTHYDHDDGKHDKNTSEDLNKKSSTTIASQEEEAKQVLSCAGPIFRLSSSIRNLSKSNGNDDNDSHNDAIAGNDTSFSDDRSNRGHLRFQTVDFSNLPTIFSEKRHTTPLLMHHESLIQGSLDKDDEPQQQNTPSSQHMRTQTAPVELFSGVNQQSRTKSFAQQPNHDMMQQQHSSPHSHHPNINITPSSTQYQRKLPPIRPELLLCHSEDTNDEYDDDHLHTTTEQEQQPQDDASTVFQTMIGPNGSWKDLYQKWTKWSQTSTALTTSASPFTNYPIQNRKLLVRKNLSLFLLQSLHSFPSGIAKSIYKLHLHTNFLKIWIVDNSGSMQTGDGKKFLESKGRVKQMVPCTRWDELRDAVLYHAMLNKDLGGAIMFRLLNDPNWLNVQNSKKKERGEDHVSSAEDGGGMDEIPQILGVCVRKKYQWSQLLNNNDTKSLGSTKKKKKNDISNNITITASDRWLSLLPYVTNNMPTTNHLTNIKNHPPPKKKKKKTKKNWEGSWQIDMGYKLDNDVRWKERAQKDFEMVERVMQLTEPRYTTPLARHMFAIHDQLLPLKTHLRQTNQKIILVIASDGIPDNVDEFYSAMQLLQKLPILLLIRLCTDDERAIHFYKTLELDFRKVDIEILDDFEVEAEEVVTMNPWMNYAMPIQRAREFGFRSSLLTILRERPLTHEELRDFIAMLFGVNASQLPHPKQDWETFYHDVESLQARESRQWNPVHKKTKTWIDMTILAKIYGGKADKVRRMRDKRLWREKSKRMRKRRKSGMVES